MGEQLHFEEEAVFSCNFSAFLFFHVVLLFEIPSNFAISSSEATSKPPNDWLVATSRFERSTKRKILAWTHFYGGLVDGAWWWLYGRCISSPWHATRGYTTWSSEGAMQLCCDRPPQIQFPNRWLCPVLGSSADTAVGGCNLGLACDWLRLKASRRADGCTTRIGFRCSCAAISLTFWFLYPMNGKSKNSERVMRSKTLGRQPNFKRALSSTSKLIEKKCWIISQHTTLLYTDIFEVVEPTRKSNQLIWAMIYELIWISTWPSREAHLSCK